MYHFFFIYLLQKFITIVISQFLESTVKIKMLKLGWGAFYAPKRCPPELSNLIWFTSLFEAFPVI